LEKRPSSCHGGLPEEGERLKIKAKKEKVRGEDLTGFVPGKGE